jgi:hypothetical protein
MVSRTGNRPVRKGRYGKFKILTWAELVLRVLEHRCPISLPAVRAGEYDFVRSRTGSYERGRIVARDDLIEQRTAKLVSAFGHYVGVHDQQVPFTGEQLATHRACIALRGQAGGVRAAVNDERFVQALQRTLRAWGIGVRGSHLVSAGDFAAALHAALPPLEALESLMIDQDLPTGINDEIWSLISSLGVVQNTAKIVAGTKTLHHLLPELIVPMDRAWTGTFFQFHLSEWQNPASQRRIFQLAYTQFAGIARRVHPQQYVTGQRWRTSRSKVIDNAVIGFCKTEISRASSPDADSDTEGSKWISFEVTGYPPAKNEALSMLGAGHPHASRVRLLLEAAQQACAAQAFTPIEDGSIALDVVLRTLPGQNPADATNYLGGIADVLEDKYRRGPLEHLSPLNTVWLYRNDRQIKQVSYREVDSGQNGYTITIRSLNNS